MPLKKNTSSNITPSRIVEKLIDALKIEKPRDRFSSEVDSVIPALRAAYRTVEVNPKLTFKSISWKYKFWIKITRVIEIIAVIVLI